MLCTPAALRRPTGSPTALQAILKWQQIPCHAAPPLHLTGVAEFLGLGKSAVYEALRTGAIPSLRIGRRIRIPSHALLEQTGIK
jgi:excisionase family DNA binding protein